MRQIIRVFLMMASLAAGCATPTVKSSASAPTIHCSLYRPVRSEHRIDYSYARPSEVVPLPATFHAYGAGLPDGNAEMEFQFPAENSVLGKAKQPVKIEHGRLEVGFPTDESYPQADKVQWRFVSAAREIFVGTSQLQWSHFKGRVVYRDQKKRAALIELIPIGFDAPGRITVPVDGEGDFDARVPARVYAAENVNSGGYGYDTLERWAWEDDLTCDREDTFLVGRTELYGIHAFDIKGGPPTVHILFRPTALSRVRQFAPDERCSSVAAAPDQFV